MFETLVIATTLLSQVTAPQEFAGKWVAQLRDQTFAQLELKVADGQLQGQLSLAGMHVDANGDVDALTGGLDEPVPIFDVALRNGLLSFARKDGDDTDRFELRLGEGRAVLVLFLDPAFRAELAQEGIPAPRPIPLTHVTP
jgi:hypothetical protein